MAIKIADRLIGEGQPVFIVAELSANHNHDLALAIKTLEAMKKSGADAVKTQTYTPGSLTIDCDNKYFKIKQGTIWDDKNLYQLYQEAYTPNEWQIKLKKAADKLGLIFFSSPFDRSAVDLLEKLKVPAYKIASFEINDHPLVEYAAKKNKPMILSTGIAKPEEISEALRVIRRSGNRQVILLKCTSSYPAQYSEMNLKTIPDMAKKFKAEVGLSDHSMGRTASLVAVALGARMIEKHFILDRRQGGPDSKFSMEPAEFQKMVREIRDVEAALGKVEYRLSEKSKLSRQFSRSLFVIEDVKKGEVFTKENVRSIRPGFGLAPKKLKLVLGKKASRDMTRGTPLKTDFIK
jgi:pseudaminic acid synthase